MRILFYRYGSICEPDILDCFNESGHEVVEITTEITKKDTTFKESVDIVDKALQNTPCDCVFTINFFPALSDLCNIYHIRYICWIVDCPVLELFAKSIANPWNRIFVFDRQQYNDIYRYNPTGIFHYSLAVDCRKKQQAINNALKSNTYSKYASEVSFVGSLYTEKSPLDKWLNPSDYLKGFVDGTIEAQLKVYGYYFVQDMITDEVISQFKKSLPDYYNYPLENFLTDKILISQYYLGNKITSVERVRLLSKLSNQYRIDLYTGSNLENITKAGGKICSNNEETCGISFRGLCTTETEMPVIFNQSKINLNPTSKAIRSGIPLRVFDIMACEGFLLSNYQPELCELFIPGEDFACYDSIEALPDIIDYYLNHDEERKEIAHNAYEKVLKEYNYYVRLNGLLLKAFEC